MEKKNGKFTISLKGILYNPQDKTFLLIEAPRIPNGTDAENSWYTNAGPWEFPGGRIQEGEDLEQAFIREMKEEIGDIKFENKGAVDYSYRLHADRPWIDVYNLLYYIEGDITSNEEVVSYRWETSDDVEKGDYHDWIKGIIRRAAKRVEENNV